MCLAFFFPFRNNNHCSQQHHHAFSFSRLHPPPPAAAVSPARHAPPPESFVKLAALFSSPRDKKNPPSLLLATRALDGGGGCELGRERVSDFRSPLSTHLVSSLLPPHSPWTGTMCATTPPDVTCGGGVGVESAGVGSHTQQGPPPPPPPSLPLPPTHHAHHLPPRPQPRRCKRHLALADAQPSHRRSQRGRGRRRDRAAVRSGPSTGWRGGTRLGRRGRDGGGVCGASALHGGGGGVWVRFLWAPAWV